ncbi:GNAT family N-acetyltransferase [Endozoicomonas sp. 8E]|uniref:GNAT family N-acetyltransferase n=1 Tax=Endozoicomonas sp. 8E TaxID=3035692 RepID=UPI00293950A2|nr:GNAT family N-acetyltransferase [Endozoicomonas sp. 8E]WOG25524.1 GNAT family N-acetyltransferase [Endozoicomonas sp. 8E]
MEIKLDDLQGQEIARLLQDHLDDMYTHSPAVSVHALDIEELRSQDITFWSAWINRNLAGCGALKALSPSEGEIKSMKTSSGFLRRGVASALLKNILSEAERRQYKTVYLETGSMDHFKPACELYERFGFEPCAPFGDYHEDPNSLFFSKKL